MTQIGLFICNNNKSLCFIVPREVIKKNVKHHFIGVIQFGTPYLIYNHIFDKDTLLLLKQGGMRKKY